MLTIGCHLSDKDGYLGMAKAAVSIGANTFQFFTRNPRGGAQKALDPQDIAAFEDYAPEHGIEVILGYAPYTANPASADQREHDFTMMVLAEDLARMAETPQAMYTLQPGSALGKPVDEALARVAAALNDVITPSQETPVLVQTMAGEGTQVGSTFEQLARILDQVKFDDHAGVLFDACRAWGAGYDLAGDLDGVVEEFDRVIGLDRLRAIHLNDSQNARGSRKDRHARIGEGQIGLEALAAVTNHPKLRDLPFYLETPNPELSGFAEEIALLRAAREAA